MREQLLADVHKVLLDLSKDPESIANIITKTFISSRLGSIVFTLEVTTNFVKLLMRPFLHNMQGTVILKFVDDAIMLHKPIILTQSKRNT